MRVLHILNELRPSGAEVMYHVAADLWKREGLDCEILSAGEKLGVFAPTLENDGYRIHHIPFSARAGLVASARHLVAVYQFLRRSRFDVIHINSEYANFWYALVAWLAGNKRLFRTIHNVFPFRGFLGVERRIQRWIMRNVLGVAMISISPSVRNTELEYYGNATLLVPNWFDSAKFQPPTERERTAARKFLGVPEGAMVIASVAGCWSYKNHPAIIRALSVLGNEPLVLYLHAGMEDEGYPERRLALDLGVAERVRFLGVVPQVLPVLHAADIYLMPSLYEGFGCAATEAMACGLPVLLSRVQGLRDFGEVCPDIYWVEPTAESIADGITHFVNMPAERRREIGGRLSQGVHEHFALEKGATACARLYRGCAASAGGEPI